MGFQVRHQSAAVRTSLTAGDWLVRFLHWSTSLRGVTFTVPCPGLSVHIGPDLTRHRRHYFEPAWNVVAERVHKRLGTRGL